MNASLLLEAATASRRNTRKEAIAAFLDGFSKEPLEDVDLDNLWEILSLAAPRSSNLDDASLFHPVIQNILEKNQRAVASFLDVSVPVISKLCGSDAAADTCYRCVYLQWSCFIWCHASEEVRKTNAKLFSRLFAVLGDALLSSSRKNVPKLAMKYLMKAAKCHGDVLLTACLEQGQLIGAQCVSLIGVCSKTVTDKLLVLHQKTIVELYLNYVLTSKIPVEQHRIAAFDSFFRSHFSEADLKGVLPTVEKMFLRSPEVILAPFSHLISLMPFDLATFLTSLTTPLLNLLKSSNATVRSLSVRSIHSFLSKSENVGGFFKSVDQFITANKGCLVDTKICLYEVLAPMTPSQAQIALPILCSWVMKETSDVALQTLLHVLAKGVVTLHDPGNEVMKQINTIFKKGMENAKENIRVAYLSALRIIVENVQVGSEVGDALVTCIKKAQQTATTTVPVDGYYAVECLQKMKSSGMDLLDSLANDVGSFVVNEKFYTKITNEDDLIVVCNVVAELAKRVKEDRWEFFSDFFVHVTFLTPKKMVRVRKRVDELLKTILGGSGLSLNALEAFTEKLVISVVKLLRKVEKASEADPFLPKYFQQFLLSVTTFSPDFIESHVPHISKRLILLLPLTNHPLFTSSLDLFTWPSLVSRLQEYSASLNPRDLITSHVDEILSAVKKASKLISNERTSYLRTLSVVVFTQPSLVPQILEMIRNELSVTDLAGVSCEDIAIWKHSDENFPFVDVLKKERKDPRTETEKWEAELRAEIEAKRSQQRRKLTKEEHGLVQAQIKKEAEIRKNIQECYNRLVNALEMICCVVNGDKTSISENVPVIMDMLCPVVDVTSKIGGKLAVEFGWDIMQHVLNTMEILGQCVSPAIQHFAKLILAVRLRFMNAVGLPSSLIADDFQFQQDRTIILIHDAVCIESGSSHGPLDPASFAFIYYVVEKVIENAISVTSRNQKLKSEETLDKAITILAYHAKLGYSLLLSRSNILKLFCSIITIFPRFARLAQNAFIEFSESIGETATAVEVTAILNALLSQSSIVRTAAIKAMKHIGVTEDTAALFTASVWVFMHDSDTNNALIAKSIWDENEMGIGPGFLSHLFPLIKAKVEDVRAAAATSYAEALELFPESFNDNLKTLYSDYIEIIKPPVPQYDKYGLVIPESLIATDNWFERAGIAQCLNSGASHFSSSTILPHFSFLLDVPGSVGDENAAVRNYMLKSGLKAIDAIAHESVNLLLPVLESHLSKSKKSSSEREDNIRESIIVFLGTVSKHMDPTDDRIKSILEKMLLALETPSESVQLAVAQCLAPLAKILKDQVQGLIERMLDQTLNGKSYAIRRGGAYGLAGLVKGKGIGSLKECNIMDSLKTAAENKKSVEQREGAMLAFEILSLTLGRLFEPYIIQILPTLLACFGDSSADVRNATADAAQVIMSNLSTHCVKLILPTVLVGLKDLKWRTKTGSIELLGATAYCAPKQLAISLPTILPKLTEMLTDSHTQVQNTAKAALAKFTDVIQNPEIKKLVPALLKALGDPSNETNNALTALVSTSFAHYIDSPSLALIAPIIERGLKERSTDVKRRSSHIIGNLTTLTDKKDLLQHLSVFVPLLKQILVDPVPDARTAASKSLGMLVEKIGEANFPGLIPELIQTLKSDTSGVDRQGAAQGLSEILSGLGMERFDSLLPEFLANCSSAKPYVREGFMLLMVFLPTTFGEKFVPYIPQVIPHILNGLADEFDYVRDASLKSAQILINKYARKSVDLLLPELEKGIFDENWRIRQSSVQLIGDILSKISGGIQLRSAITADDEDEETGDGNETGRKEIINVLGVEHFNSLLSALYIIRSDVNVGVRQASVHVWKAMVVNTPKTLREILPVIMDIIIVSLASSNYDKRQVAAATLGDLVHKLGENVLRIVFPILESRIKDIDENTRQGVCIGLQNILQTCAEEYVEFYAPRAIEIVKLALVDVDADVRESASKVFDELYKTIGSKIIEQVVPPLLAEFKKAQVDKGQLSNALGGLKEILSVRSNVFPYLLPILLETPITKANAEALSSLILVAGSATIQRQTARLLDSLLPALDQGEASEDIRSTLVVLMESIEDNYGAQSLMMYLQEKTKVEVGQKMQLHAMQVLGMFFTNNKKIDTSAFANDWISVLVGMLDSSVVGDKLLVEQAWMSFNAMVQSLKKDTLDKYLHALNRAVSNLIADVKIKTANEKSEIDGFILPKGLSPFLTMSLHGFMYAGSDTRQLACSIISNLISYTDAEHLKPFVIQIAGPFIRILGEKIPSHLKSAILLCLTQLLNKVPASVKPFIPQLQRSFLKCLSDETQDVRLKASSALGSLVSLQTQIDPLMKELEKGLKDEQIDVKEIILATIWQILDNSGGKISTVSRDIVKKGVFMERLWTAHQEKVRWNAALVSGLLMTFLDEAESINLIRSLIAECKMPEAPVELKHGLLVMISSVMQKSLLLPIIQDVLELIRLCLSMEKPILNDMALILSARLLFSFSEELDEKELIDLMLGRISNSENADTKRVGLSCFLTLSVRHFGLTEKYVTSIVPVSMRTIKDRNIPLKLISERCLCAVLKIYETDSYVKKYVEGTNDRNFMDYYSRVLVNVAKNMTADSFADDVESILGKLTAK